MPLGSRQPLVLLENMHLLYLLLIKNLYVMVMYFSLYSLNVCHISKLPRVIELFPFLIGSTIIFSVKSFTCITLTSKSIMNFSFLSIVFLISYQSHDITANLFYIFISFPFFLQQSLYNLIIKCFSLYTKNIYWGKTFSKNNVINVHRIHEKKFA